MIQFPLLLLAIAAFYKQEAVLCYTRIVSLINTPLSRGGAIRVSAAH
ncbi:MAG: hypothetical protein RMZ41_026120 [Nostoc sp. DedVER02]